MGNQTRASGFASTAMGSGSTASGDYSTTMGFLTTASGDRSTALGYRAKANHAGALVWADTQGADFPSTAANQFRVRAAGGMEVVGGTIAESFKYSGARAGGFFAPVGYGENNNISGNSGPALRLVTKGGVSVDGVLSVSTQGTGDLATFGNASVFVSRLSTNGTWTALAFNPTSDRNAKENSSPVDSGEVLAKVAALPLARWNYKEAPGLDHIGPVAQDFHAAFGLNGDDDKHIATVDADGVALAAIQGLNAKVEAQRVELEQKLTALGELQQQNADLLRRLEALEARLR